MTKKAVMLLALLGAEALASVKSTDGNELGNGGDAIICSRPYPLMNDNDIMFLDIYVARYKGYPIDFNNPNEHELVLARKVIERIRHFDPDRFDRYMLELEKWDENTKNEYGLLIPNLPDHGVVDPPEPGADCRIEQIAHRQEVIEPDDKRYNIRRELWDRLDKESKVGLILHEIIYREAWEAGHRTSRRVRIFVRNLANPEIGNWHPLEYAKFLRQGTDLPQVRTIDGIKFDMHSIKYDDNFLPEAGMSMINAAPRVSLAYQTLELPAGTAFAFYPSQRVRAFGPVRIPEGIVLAVNGGLCRIGEIATDGIIERYESRAIAAIATEEEFQVGVPLCLDDGLRPSLKVNTTRVEFYPNGMLMAASLANGNDAIDPPIPTGCALTIDALKSGSAVEFYENGFPKVLTLAKDTMLCTNGGGRQVFGAGSQIIFNPQGLVDEWDFGVKIIDNYSYNGGDYEG